MYAESILQTGMGSESFVIIIIFYHHLFMIASLVFVLGIQFVKGDPTITINIKTKN